MAPLTERAAAGLDDRQLRNPVTEWVAAGYRTDLLTYQTLKTALAPGLNPM
jgi:hypothetical protein